MPSSNSEQSNSHPSASGQQRVSPASSVIPNVSSVFRDLVHISTHTNTTGFGNRAVNDVKYQPFDSRNRPSNNNFVSDMAQDRQRKHLQLMGRLKRSKEESNILFGVGNSNNNSNSNNYANSYNNEYGSLPSYNNNPNYSNSISNPTSWMAPKLKYRHISDFVAEPCGKHINQEMPYGHRQKQYQKQQNYSNNNRVRGIVNQQSRPFGLPKYLEQELKARQAEIEKNQHSRHHTEQGHSYDHYQRTQQKMGDTALQFLHQQKQQPFNQDEDDNEKFQRLRKQYNKTVQDFNQNNETKYEDKLQNYYELCKKQQPVGNRPASSSSSSRQPRNNQFQAHNKFTRAKVPKVEGINLEKAINILSMD